MRNTIICNKLQRQIFVINARMIVIEEFKML